jgi:hypothetical protein
MGVENQGAAMEIRRTILGRCEDERDKEAHGHDTRG